jgi:hypothetical protein
LSFCDDADQLSEAFKATKSNITSQVSHTRHDIKHNERIKAGKFGTEFKRVL